MPGGITLIRSNNADIPTPAAGKATLFYSNELGAPAFKDEAGVVHIFGLNNVSLPPINFFDDITPDDFISFPTTGSGGSSTFPLVVTGSMAVLSNTGVVIPETIEINAGIIFEIGDGARVEITGPTNDLSEFLDICKTGLPGGTVALSTLGTFDWFAFGSSALGGSPPRANSPTSSAFHASKNGTYIMHSFDWINNGGTTFFNNQNSSVTYSTTTADDINGTAFSGTAGSGVFLVAGALYGFKFSVPASRKRRRLFFYASFFSADVIITATFKGSGTQKTHLIKGASGLGHDAPFQITFESDSPQDLEIQCQLSVVLGVNQSANAKLMYAYVADA